MIARLYRIIPLVIVLAIIALAVYFVVSYRSSPNRAKEVLIKSFTWLTGIISGFFALASLYALLERNYFALDIMAGFLAVTLIALGIVLVCKAVFLKHHPQYRKEASAEVARAACAPPSETPGVRRSPRRCCARARRLARSPRVA